MSKNRKIRETSATARGNSAGRSREVLGVVCLGAAIFLTIAMVSLQAGKLVMGPFGRSTASLFYGLAGMCGYALIALAVVAAVRTLIDRHPVMPRAIALGVGIGVIALATLAHLAFGSYRVASHGPGGAVGEHLAEILRALISTAGTALLACVGLVVAVVVATPLRMREVLYLIGAGACTVGNALKLGLFAFARFWGDVFRAILPERRDEDDDQEEEEEERGRSRGRRGKAIEVEEDDVLEVGADDHVAEPMIIERGSALAEDAPAKKPRGKKPAVSETQDTEVMLAVVPPIEVVKAETGGDVIALKPKRSRFPSGTKAPEPANDEQDSAPVGVPAIVAAAASSEAGPMIVEPRFKHADANAMAAKEQAAEADRRTFIKLGEGDYQLPSIQLLNYDTASQNTIDRSAMLELSAKLTQTLENYGVKGEVVAIRPGPVVTMYEFAPAPGTRVNKIVNLTDDLALALEALRVRIVAPIPGKAAVGIEVPNKSREKVFLKEILADELFLKGRAKLPMAIGKDIEGGPMVVDLAKMPHLLVAGTTGSGKSVAVNAMITSLLYNCSPEDVRMIMVDPKMLELSIYEGIPHLLLPVVTDPKKANLALRWAVEEMERR
ncbi:MAG: DNA translocase FtsK 4TM domain-containing protein, partial [Deltaproteobacteria bacterium]|nr:DNA translocase FtsK 4TM domain-containing protein [Deltaproteobacteria bacterium]